MVKELKKLIVLQDDHISARLSRQAGHGNTMPHTPVTETQTPQSGHGNPNATW